MQAPQRSPKATARGVRARGFWRPRRTMRCRLPARETSGRPIGLEFAVQHQQRRTGLGKLGADLLAMGCGFGIGAPARNREPRPYRALTVLETSRTDPAVLDRRVNIGCIRGRGGHTGETKCAVVRSYDRAGFLTEIDESSIAKGEPRLIEGIEFFKDQECDRLAE